MVALCRARAGPKPRCPSSTAKSPPMPAGTRSPAIQRLVGKSAVIPTRLPDSLSRARNSEGAPSGLFS